ncbi:fimbria/pilus outer membrane usher protein [Serratia ureilytica]|uniref:fimbria/pilus outer membrane usher protein n=1 Tax=Serratia ureilytica TaxID=300181 RepID=UPI00159C2CA4|nr:fimbria/pilus outer membrane usher protein [Serratia ureilytica]NVM51921.1 fimbria/pilus outer membrane usher protein [Serratia ureilytica]
MLHAIHDSRCRPLRRLLPLLIAALCAGHVEAADELQNHDNLTFDTGVLSGRGIDPAIAALFGQAPRFLPGENTVSLSVNGNARGRVRVKFDEAGVLCADRAFQRAAGLVSPPGYADGAACFDLRRAWPQAEIQPEPGEGKVILVVPSEALSAPDTGDGNWQHGGVAGMLNYDAQYLSSSGGAGGLNFGQLGTEAGFNAGDWIVRSRQTFTRFNGDDRINHQAAYAQRSFVGIKKVLQAGQVSLSNSLFGTGQVLGFQLFPESALTSGQGGAGLVEGVAQTQSVVEVRQSGVLVYSTAVPAGPFRLQGFSLLNTRTDLEVTLTGSNGEIRKFIVPAATLLARAPLVSPGLSFGAGRLEQQDGKAPLLGTVASGWQLTPFTSLNAGVLGSAPYRAGSLNLDTQLWEPTRLSLQSTLAQDADHGNTGTLLSALLSHSLSERLSVNVNGRQQTTGYRELSDALQRADQDNPNSQSRSRYQWGSGVNWSAERLGNLSLSWARSTTFAGNNTDYLRGGWSRQFGRAYLGVSLEHNTGTLSGQADDRLYVSFSMPLGEGRDINSYLNTAKRSARAGVRYSDRTSQDRGWSIATDRDLRNNRTSVSGNLDFVTPVSQLNASVSHDSDNYTSWSTRAGGAIVLHENGITLSPYRVADTFGIARVGKESGVRLDTPAGPVWTDWRGYAVIPTLNGYRRSAIQVDTRSLAKNVDIGNAWQESEMARGAIGRVDFDVLRTRRVLVGTAMADDKRLPHGASVFSASGELVTVVGDDGTVFVPDATPGMRLEVQSSGKTVCTMQLDLPEKADTTGLYENATATCR